MRYMVCYVLFDFQSGAEVQNCALCTSNRYAYSILEILSISHSVPIIPGGHFPEIDKPEVEKARRYNWLQEWGITRFELEMEVFSPEDYKEEGATATTLSRYGESQRKSGKRRGVRSKEKRQSAVDEAVSHQYELLQIQDAYENQVGRDHPHP